MEPPPAARPKRKPAPLTLVSSLVRGANLVCQKRRWNKIGSAVNSCANARVRLLTDEEVRDATEEQQLVWASNLARNERWLTIFCGFLPAGSRAIDKACAGLLDICGKSDWAAEDVIMVFPNVARSRAEALEKLVAYTKSAFLSGKPEKPAEARWTGVVGAASFFGRLLAFGAILLEVMGLDQGARRAADVPAPLAADEEDHILGDNLVQFALDPQAWQKLDKARTRQFTRWVCQPNRRALLQCYLLVVLNKPVRNLLFFIFKHEGGQGRAPTAHELEKINNRYMLGLTSFDVDATARAARFAPETGQGAEDAESPYLEWYTGRPVEHALRTLAGFLAQDQFLDEVQMLFGSAGGVVSDDILVLAR